ncbi:hypothetical protein Tco_0733130 [Tanacetum coccineum]
MEIKGIGAGTTPDELYQWRPLMHWSDTELGLESVEGNPQQALKNKGIFDSGCSRHMTRNKDFLIDYQDMMEVLFALGKSRADDSTGESPIQKPASENEQALKNVLDKMMDQEKEATKQSDAVRKEFEAQCDRQNISGKATKASSTNSFNTVSTPVNAASASRTYNVAGSSFVPLGGMGCKATDFNKDQKVNLHCFSQSLFPSTNKTPQKIAQALDDESWVEAMQEELLQFKI